MQNLVSVMFKGMFSKNRAISETLEDGMSEVFLDMDEKVKTDIRPYVFPNLENKFKKNVRVAFFNVNYVSEDPKDNSEETKDNIREVSVNTYLFEKNKSGGSVGVYREAIIIGSYKETKKIFGIPLIF